MRTAAPANRDRPAARFFDCAFLYALGGFTQVIVLSSVLTGDITPLMGLAYHGAVLALVAGMLVLLAGRLETHHALALFLLAFSGPVGAVMGMWFSYRFTGNQFEPPPELLVWYDTLAGQGIDFSARLSDVEAAGEDDMALLDPGAPTLADIVRNGTLAERRNAIARMAAAYHRDYYPLLASALEDPEPTIRVQAAAILTGLGQEEREKLDACIEELPHAPREKLLDQSQAIAGYMTSRLLDAEGLRLASRAMAPIVAHVLTTGSADDIGRLRMQLVWCAQGVPGNQSAVLHALLQKLVVRQTLDRVS